VCVVPATTEFNVSPIFRLTKKADPSLERTLFVRTMFDDYLRDAGKNIEDLFKIGGARKNGIFCTINRNQDELNKRISIKAVREN